MLVVESYLLSYSTGDIILGILLDNAIKYTPQGGRVDVSLCTDDGLAVIEVVDTGIGIDPSDCERVFERFYRVDKARSRELGGTGLGLAIARKFVELHRGRIWVESEEGRGSTFYVAVPLKG